MVRGRVCGVAFWKKDSDEDGRKVNREWEARTKCGCIQAITHPPPEVPPPVSNSTGKSCCSVEVVSEGAKKEKKASISVRMGGCCLRNGVECCGSGGRMTGWRTPSHPLSPYICHRCRHVR